jgi:putative penicillin-binding protein 2
MEKHGIKVILIGRGRVIQQSVAPGEKIKKGMKCELRFG